MKLFFNLMLRQGILHFDIEEGQSQPCFKCVSMVNMLDTVMSSSKIIGTHYDRDYICVEYGCEIDMVSAEDPSIGCTKFKELDLKKI